MNKNQKPVAWLLTHHDSGIQLATTEPYTLCKYRDKGYAVQPLDLVSTLQAGNSPVSPDGWIKCSERMPLTPHENCLYEDVEIQVFDGNSVFIAHYSIGALPEPWGAWLDTSANITHWQPLAKAPLRELK